MGKNVSKSSILAFISSSKHQEGQRKFHKQGVGSQAETSPQPWQHPEIVLEGAELPTGAEQETWAQDSLFPGKEEEQKKKEPDSTHISELQVATLAEELQMAAAGFEEPKRPHSPGPRVHIHNVDFFFN